MTALYLAARALVERLYAHRARLMAEHQARWDAHRARFIAAWRRANPRRRTVPTVFPELIDDLERARADVECVYAALASAIKAAEVQERAAAEGVTLQPSGEVWSRVDSVCTSSYSSQGWGATTYARNAAEASADHYRAQGLRVEVRRRTAGRDLVYFEVWAEASADEARVARLKPGQTLREWVRMCWRRGVNPRVYNPFLPHGYEERAGLDYFGNDKRRGGEA